MADKAYHNLLASLPHLNSLFNSKVTPISRYELERRLSALSFEERALLSDIEVLMHWDHEEKKWHDEARLIRDTSRLLARVRAKPLRELIEWRLDMRTVIAALRRKRAGEKAPNYPQWSVGTRYEYVRRHWNVAYFNLQHTFPWLPDVASYMEQNRSLDAEKVLLQAVWDHLGRIEASQGFSFTAVVIYVLRWNLIHRWTSYHSEQALQRFDHLVSEALGDVALELEF